MNEEKRKLPHTLCLTERKTLSVNGVTQAGNFDEETVTLFVSDGKLVVHGQGLQVERLSIETGEVEISGLVTALQYSDNTPRAKGFFAKVMR